MDCPHCGTNLDKILISSSIEQRLVGTKWEISEMYAPTVKCARCYEELDESTIEEAGIVLYEDDEENK
jgi:hypothetical protein